MIHLEEEWVQICKLDDFDVVFTSEFIDATAELGGQARTFAAYLATHWNVEFGRMLDYFGPDDAEEDTYTGIDGQPMDVREDIPYLWELRGLPISGLTCEWYRDIMRAKLVTLKIPKRLIVQYVSAFKKQDKEF